MYLFIALKGGKCKKKIIICSVIRVHYQYIYTWLSNFTSVSNSKHEYFVPVWKMSVWKRDVIAFGKLSTCTTAQTCVGCVSSAIDQSELALLLTDELCRLPRTCLTRYQCTIVPRWRRSRCQQKTRTNQIKWKFWLDCIYNICRFWSHHTASSFYVLRASVPRDTSPTMRVEYVLRCHHIVRASRSVFEALYRSISSLFCKCIVFVFVFIVVCLLFVSIYRFALSNKIKTLDSHARPSMRLVLCQYFWTGVYDF